MERTLTRIKYFLENLDELLLKQGSQVKKALFFKALFKKLPTYEQIKTGNTKTPQLTGVNSLIALLPAEKSLVVTHVDQNWNSIERGLQQIDRAVEEV